MENKCDCGAEKTWGSKPGDRAHSDWCSASIKNVVNRIGDGDGGVCFLFRPIAALSIVCVDCGKKYAFDTILTGSFGECVAQRTK